MNHYVVTWTIDIEAGSARDAAQMALDIQRNPKSDAVCFHATENDGTRVFVDLNDDVCEPKQ